MEKIYTYSPEEEEAMNRKFGYTEEQIDGLSYKQYQYSIGIPEILGWFRWTFHKACPRCQTKLIWKKELTYLGLCRPGHATGGTDFRKAYRVSRILVCPDCHTKFSICDKRV